MDKGEGGGLFPFLSTEFVAKSTIAGQSLLPN